MGHETVAAITDNIEAALSSGGLNVTREATDAGGSVPAGQLPVAQVSYKGEIFEDTFGERPGYAQARFMIKVILPGQDGPTAMAGEQKYAHQVRSAMTCTALNAGELAATQPVVSVRIPGFEIEQSGSLSKVSVDVNVRYRES